MLNTPFSPWPSFTQEEADAISRILLSNKVNYWTGDEVSNFEKEFAKFANCKHAIAVANGSLALELALKGLGVGPGDEVITSPRSFLASASSIVMVGATPVFADVDRDSQNITAESIHDVMTSKTKAIIPVHLSGFPCEMDEINALAKDKNLFVVEDCAQAHGARYKGKSVGSLGDVGAWSFCQDKIITTGGEGGIVTTDNDEVWERMWSYKDHGRSRDAIFNRQHPPGFRYTCDSFGSNWRLTAMQAAIGRIQINRMKDWHEKREQNAKRIYHSASSCGAYRVPKIPSHSEHAWYKCYLFINPEQLDPSWTRDRMVSEIAEAGVPCMHGPCPEIYKEKAFEAINRKYPELPIAIELGQTSLMLMVHPTLTDEEVSKTCDVLVEVGKRALR